ncbi:LOW QUALITY PROTEIN: hypothetical protein T265_12691 [Opisthorchis viverrini]|uniref:PHF5-like protein n=1 Tax=Opisthorchis viverrini TaxID=6198 RepID=A0A075AJB7_OPIVI|nr:LOW QUALITY PROTEIN: hypothetical protein T265_12691 [Opisthorchis viverrini]KER33104.1 LOW QUALITY PROTEIN: hypothetical protein T265_12691 [Opisthorchis viverrini]
MNRLPDKTRQTRRETGALSAYAQTFCISDAVTDKFHRVIFRLIHQTRITESEVFAGDINTKVALLSFLKSQLGDRFGVDSGCTPITNCFWPALDSDHTMARAGLTIPLSPGPCNKLTQYWYRARGVSMVTYERSYADGVQSCLFESSTRIKWPLDIVEIDCFDRCWEIYTIRQRYFDLIEQCAGGHGQSLGDRSVRFSGRSLLTRPSSGEGSIVASINMDMLTSRSTITVVRGSHCSSLVFLAWLNLVEQSSSQSIGRLCEKCDGKCVICDSYVRPCTLVRICDECNYGSYQGRCVICGGPGVSDAYYCRQCTCMEKDRDGCPKIVNLGSAKTDLFYERKKWLKWLEREFTNRKVRGSSPTFATRLPLSRFGQPGSIPALVFPSGGMTGVRHGETGPYPGVAVCVPRGPIELYWVVSARHSQSLSYQVGQWLEI